MAGPKWCVRDTGALRPLLAGSMSQPPKGKLPKSYSTCSPRTLRCGMSARFMEEFFREEKCFILGNSEGEAMGSTYSWQPNVDFV